MGYTDDPRVVAAINDLKASCKDKEFSDLISGPNGELQYVDLVMEGGGVLGIALVGYTYALEQAGLRFQNVGGASAGAINAMALAALGTPAEGKTDDMIQILSSVDISKFVDGDSDAQDFIENALGGSGWLTLAFKGAQVVDTLKAELGLNPGEVFESWLAKEFEAKGINTTQQLLDRLAVLPDDFRRRDGEPLTAHDRSTGVKVVAAEVHSQTKVVFPRDAETYWKNHLQVSPACYVRASMSIPVFFQPRKGTFAGMFVDGGVMSNFPIDLFHGEGVPPAPTLGVMLGEQKLEPVKTLGQLLMSTFDCARHDRDREFIRKNPDYKQLVTWIDTGDHNWLNFSISEPDKIDLFYRGVQTAVDFLKGFDWPAYKETRRRLASASGC